MLLYFQSLALIALVTKVRINCLMVWYASFCGLYYMKGRALMVLQLMLACPTCSTLSKSPVKAPGAGHQKYLFLFNGDVRFDLR